MNDISWGALLCAALVGSVMVLFSMYFLLPALGLPQLDFASITAGWVKASGKYARPVGVIVFLLGGIAWAILYAALWPWRGVVAGMGYSLAPFLISCLTVLPELFRFRPLVVTMPGFIWVKSGGPTAVMVNLSGHLIFGLCLGLLY